MQTASGHTLKPVDGKELKEQQENFEGYKGGLERMMPGNWLIPTEFLPYLDKIYSFKFKPTDVFIVTYPKCGTTWMQEIVWTMVNSPNLDHPMASVGINSRCPFLELDAMFKMTDDKPITSNGMLMNIFNKLCPDKDTKDGVFIQMADATPEPRTIKCHLPLSMIHPSVLDKCKVIYVARNPKDVCISYLHHSRLMKAHYFKGSQDKFVDYFVKDDLIYSPYGLHLKEAWDKRNHKNMHFVFYEDMKANPTNAIKEINSFLGTQLNEEQISNVVDYTSFASMKSRGNLLGGSEGEFMVESVLKNDGGFFRKGEAGSWKEKLTEEQERKIEKWANEHTAELSFKYK